MITLVSVWALNAGAAGTSRLQRNNHLNIPYRFINDLRDADSKVKLWYGQDGIPVLVKYHASNSHRFLAALEMTDPV
jgi:hypothetical protein